MKRTPQLAGNKNAATEREGKNLIGRPAAVSEIEKTMGTPVVRDAKRKRPGTLSDVFDVQWHPYHGGVKHKPET